MAVPVQKTTSIRNETYGGVTYHIEGELVPVLQIEMPAGERIFFEHHILLWKDPRVDIELMHLKGALKRMVAGMPLIMTQTHGPGRIAFSRDGVGHVMAMHLKPGEGLDVREHQWLAATSAVDYSFAWVKGAANILFGGTGLFVDTFQAHADREGIVWLHGYGNVFEVQLEAGEQIDMEPGAWVYKDRTVDMQTVLQKLASGLFGSTQIFWNRFTGPGRVGLQSMYMQLYDGTASSD